MRKQILPIVGCLCGALLTGSCNKFLDPNPTDVLTPDNFYKSGTDAISAVNGVYAQMPYTYLFWWYMTDLPCDVLFANAGFGADGHQFADYNLDKTLHWFNDEWVNFYITIDRANIVIAKVPGIQMDATTRARVVGEAKFLRALTYFHLVSFFGDVPLVTTEITNAAQAKLPRTPKAQVYAQIISDLQAAAQSLPASYTGTDVGRATSGAATTLLAKVYLYQKDWTHAAQVAGQVITSGQYSLNPVWNDNFSIPKELTNPEDIFSLQYGSPETVTGVIGQVQLLFGLPSGFPGGDAYAIEQMMPSYVNSFSASDVRGDHGTFMVPPYHISTAGYDTTITWGVPSGAAPRKPLDETDKQNMHARSWEQQGNFQHFLRYADVLLMYAEAVNEGGTPVGGMTASRALDLVRQRGDANASSTASLGQGAFRDTLRIERGKEFGLEGQCWFDQQRWGTLDAVARLKQAELGTVAPGETSVHGAQGVPYYPIPQAQINLDPALTQNPGW
jgi:hypothetical protein